ncbi:anther-specific protein RTS-like [Brachypodium distachyon]|uniref:Uncharacterized protein n=1 Tax=Brachypodium distachyon TaxID=15368 RepID=A0A2K2DGW3_BRADI|nr:anther-specific protein RTS-like [Brachypodium distachyon]PNT73517.1 hypothetical protein BRADI_2g59580v3 [Brachypodium distachyon]|eukprot:XP_024315996.1 anther-specific protein RTS-like [Brachypodium distachyon]
MAAATTTVDVVEAKAAGNLMAAPELAGGRRARGGARRARPAGLTQCVADCGNAATSCLLDCYKSSTMPSAVRIDDERKLLPVCLLDCTNAGMFRSSDCSSQNNLN